MTWSRHITVGGGPQSFRVVIEGYPTMWVTSRVMEVANGDGRMRRVGLKQASIEINERCYPAEGRLEADSMTLEIVDVSKRATVEFTSEPTVRTFLTAGVSSSATSFTVLSSAGFVIDSYYHIGTEVVKVTAIPDSTHLTVSRSQWNTLGQAHFVESGGNLAYPEITDVPVLMQGRRVFVHAYGGGDSLASAGTLIWRGRVAEEPRALSPTTWQIPCDPITEILNHELCAAIDEPVRLTGIYYSWADPLVIRAYRLVDANRPPSATSVVIGPVLITGKFDTQEQFCSAVTAALVTPFGTANGVLGARPTADGGWEFFYTTAAASPKYILLEAYSSVDGIVTEGLYAEDAVGGDAAGSVSAGTTYVRRWNSSVDATIAFTPRRNPRASYLGAVRVSDGADVLNDPTASATAPNTRLYLERAFALTTSSRLTIGTVPRAVSAVSAASGYVDLTEPIPISLANDMPFEDLRIVKHYVTGKLDEFRDALVTDGINANDGSTPDIRTADVADWTAAVRAAGARSYTEARDYTFSKPVKLEDVLAEECKLHGLFPYIDADGKISLRVLTPPTQTQGVAATIDSSKHLVGQNGWGTVETNIDGVFNTVVLKTGWDREEEKHLGETFQVREVRSISRLKKRRVLEIAPKVVASAEPVWEDAATIAAGVMALYGHRYEIVKLYVSRQAFSVLCGDTIALNVNVLPYRGDRGIRDSAGQDVNGIVVGRRWNMAQACGELTVFVTGLRVVGYTPTARVTGQSNTGGNTWLINTEANRYAATGVNDASHFEVGDKVRVRQWDNAAPTSVLGTVGNVQGTDITVTFDAVWTPGVSTWNLIYQASTAATSQQLRYAFCAGPDGYIDTSGADVAAYVSAP